MEFVGILILYFLGIFFVGGFALLVLLRTRLVARTAVGPLDGRVVAALGRGRARESDGERTPTGDAHFDRVFDVRGTAARDVETVLRQPVRRALQQFPTPMVGASLRLVVDGDEVLVEWAGGEVDSARLDAGHAILRAACGAEGEAPT